MVKDNNTLGLKLITEFVGSALKNLNEEKNLNIEKKRKGIIDGTLLELSREEMLVAELDDGDGGETNQYFSCPAVVSNLQLRKDH